MAVAMRVARRIAATSSPRSCAGEEAHGGDRVATGIDPAGAARQRDRLPLEREPGHEPQRRQRADGEPRRDAELLHEPVGQGGRVAGGDGEDAGERDRNEARGQPGAADRGVDPDPQRADGDEGAARACAGAKRIEKSAIETAPRPISQARPARAPGERPENGSEHEEAGQDDRRR